jgi:photosystem II stability/assembly factor-like uncharacterized protein
MNCRLLIPALYLCCLPWAAKSQTQPHWIVQGANINKPAACVADISAVNDSVAWAISAVLEPGSGGCSIPANNFTKTTDGGNTWQAGTISLPSSYTPSCIYALDGQTAWVTAFDLFDFASGRIYKTVDGGASWTFQSSASFQDAARFIHFFNAGDGVAVGDSTIFITSDGGTNWVDNGGLPLPFNVVTAFLLNSYEVAGDIIWLGDAYGDFYKSIDRGHTWVHLPQSLYPNAIKGIAFKDSLNGIAIAAHFVQGGNGGGAFTDDTRINHTSDGGVTWTTSFIFFNNFMINTDAAKYDVAFIPGSGNTYLLTQEYSGSVGYSAISYDGGMIWVPVDSNIRHTALAFTPTGNGWSGGYFTSLATGMFKWVSGQPSSIPGLANTAVTVQTYPNPAVDQLQLVFPQPVSDAAITITDAAGKVLHTQIGAAGPSHVIGVNISTLPPGTYSIQIRTGVEILSSKFVKN